MIINSNRKQRKYHDKVTDRKIGRTQNMFWHGRIRCRDYISRTCTYIGHPRKKKKKAKEDALKDKSTHTNIYHTVNTHKYISYRFYHGFVYAWIRWDYGNTESIYIEGGGGGGGGYLSKKN
jgi:hypothetical protein